MDNGNLFRTFKGVIIRFLNNSEGGDNQLKDELRQTGSGRCKQLSKVIKN